MRNIETKWLYDFLTLEACRHFSQAAKERNISQPAFSRRIKALEAAIGVVLFDRTSTPLQLTEGGKLFHSQARSLLQQLECNLRELNGQNLLGVPNIKIAAAHSLSLGVLPKLLHSLTAYGGEFVYHVEAIDVVQAVNTLREGQSDFIISFRDEDLMQSPFCCLKLFESELYPVCAADTQGHPIFDITQPQVPLLNYTATSYMGRLVNRHLSEVGGITGRTILISSMSELLKNMALNRYGIAWLPIWSIVNELQTKRLVRLDAANLIVPIQAYIYRMNTRLNRNAENFWRILQEHTPNDLIHKASMIQPVRRY
ncbi:hypochlorite stress DNA-binding transcriptional regulator HypT [Escherichia coli]|uniref:hypochlorite stress DNA-binding transcriptional regulator HypT n=1 Tax=Enterobacteriaceae TaxID=543 RepID=UPI000BE58FB5|nr:MULTISPECIES: hypochlorite stress DNA-binding transcriptional regulator HypT [Enterobacteriaceae]EIM6718874.1 hypochlorite stress DNA-binding transcriptional regulator HypT [Salmonella enterica subsp. enterica serovar Senftenberg]EIY3990377.1 hypochlorite stress DNA-binding transcriptional regulator HypT [Salmonella enterica]EAC2074466.1 HTH-type transcriptional regulator [Escherichia coli]EEU9125631.1 hypochlorite stress DNA-binding transcriptional regulator HypT [Escherichia coli]EEV90333